MSFLWYFKTYVAPAMPVIAAVLIYVLGKSAYFRQKEYELVTKRYLEEGLDAISKNVERSLALFRHNWWKSTVVLKHFRDLGKDMRADLYQSPFIEPDPSLFEVWRDYRLVDVVGDDIFNRAHQSLDAFVKSSYAFFQDDLGAMVRVTLKGGKELEVKAPRDKMIVEYIKEIERLDEKANRYYVLLGELQKLGSIIQTERFSFRRIRKIKSRKDVQDAVNRLKKLFLDTVETTNTPPNAVGPNIAIN